MYALQKSLAVLASFSLLAGCGGGGGGSTAESPPVVPSTLIAGVAAGGAPIYGTVIAKDSKGATFGPATIGTEGSYSIDVKGGTGPFLLKADGLVGGKAVSLVSSAATADVGGTINVTPFTDLAVANAAGMDTSTLYANCTASACDLSKVTKASVDAAATALKTRLQPLLTAFGVTANDLLRDTFKADHTGLDQVLDAVKVNKDSTTPTTATLVNAATGATLLTNDATNSSTTQTLVPNSDDLQVVAAVKPIEALFKTFQDLVATSLPSANNATLNDMFDASFLHDGHSKADMITSITTDPTGVGQRFSNVALANVNALDPGGANSASAVWVSFIITNPDGSIDRPVMKFVKGSDGKWRIAGNQRSLQLDQVSVQARAESFGTSFRNGLTFFVTNSDAQAQGVSYVIVNGAGLHNPLNTNSAIKLVLNTNNQPMMSIAGTNNAYILSECPAAGTSSTSCVDFTVLKANGLYTFDFYNASGTKLASYVETLPKEPRSTALDTNMFPVITSISATGLASFTSGATISVAWALPLPQNNILKSSFISIGVWNAAGVLIGSNFGAPVKATDTSGSASISTYSGQRTSANVGVSALDIYGRLFTTFRTFTQ